jgi:hypothetical protein
MSVISPEYSRMRSTLARDFENKMATPMKFPKLSSGRPKLSESEKKRRRKTVLTEWNKGRVAIGNQIGRWNATRKETGVKTNVELARILLDR